MFNSMNVGNSIKPGSEVTSPVKFEKFEEIFLKGKFLGREIFILSSTYLFLFLKKKMVEGVIVVMIIVLVIILLLFILSIYHVARYFSQIPSPPPNSEENIREVRNVRNASSIANTGKYRSFLNSVITYGKPFLTATGKMVTFSGGKDGQVVINRQKVTYEGSSYVFLTGNGQNSISPGNYFILRNQTATIRMEMA